MAALVLGLVGCKGIFKADEDDPTPLSDITFDTFVQDTQINTDPLAGKGLGETCQPNPGGLPECRFGLDCIDGVCAAAGDTAENNPCVLTQECGAALHCGLIGVCEPAGEGEVGTGCSTAADCSKGLVCRSLGFSGSCADPGDLDVGATCSESLDCLAGLSCNDGACGAGSLTLGFTPWTGVECATTADEGPPRVYFELPGDGSSEFFRLPYPNDIRFSGGGLDLTGFPTPGPGLVGFDPVERIVDAAEAGQRGFSTEPVITFRFSAPYDLGSVWAEGVPDPPEGEPTLYFLNIDPDSPGYNTNPAFGYFLTDGGTRYICPRYLSIKPSWDTPLAPDTTYAVVLASGIQTADGTPLERDDDMATLLRATRPEGAEGVAWEAYSPLRSYLADTEERRFDENRVLAATVFTTAPIGDVVPAIRDAIHGEAVPTPSELTLCDGTATSPCDDGLSGDDHRRGCFEVQNDVYELHMRVALPRVQSGQRPYLAPEDGGDLVIDDDGAVVLQGTEAVCVSLTIPKNATMPEAGWPLALFGHGTGGTFRSGVNNAGVPLSSVSVATEDAGDVEVGIAVAAWDGPMHGERRGADLDPDGLYFNVANPLAARGNVYQGAADIFELVRVFKDLVIAADDSGIGAEIRFDASKLAYIGHSQGANYGPIATPYEPDLDLQVWSGAGAGLSLSLQEKTQPVDVSVAVAIALQEFTETGLADVGDLHPVMDLVQGLFTPVDPLNYAGFQVDRPIDLGDVEGAGPKHTLHVYGLGDSFTPPGTIETFARLMRIPVATPVLMTLGPLSPEIAAPVTGNITRGDRTVTAAQIQTQPNGYDGHFVLFRDLATSAQFTQFMGTWVVDDVPTLPAR